MRKIEEIDEIVLHCSATREGQDITAKTIDGWHIKRGFKKIGYHLVIRLDGSREYGRKLTEIGAHVKGRNSKTVGVCYIGGCDKNLKPKDTMNEAQEKSFREYVKELRELTKKHLKISGHNEYAAKACPSFKVSEKFFDIL
jgi:N-acetylmuramoyl-L-alanine amidase